MCLIGFEVINFLIDLLGGVELFVSGDHWPEHGRGCEGAGVAAEGEEAQDCHPGELEAG